MFENAVRHRGRHYKNAKYLLLYSIQKINGWYNIIGGPHISEPPGLSPAHNCKMFIDMQYSDMGDIYIT